jgi:hypothetical protein
MGKGMVRSAVVGVVVVPGVTATVLSTAEAPVAVSVTVY